MHWRCGCCVEWLQHSLPHAAPPTGHLMLRRQLAMWQLDALPDAAADN
jgi:hypothetical protein